MTTTLRLLKLLKLHSVILFSGRTDIPCISLNPEHSTIPYNSIVVEDSNNTNYNLSLIDEYMDDGILTLITADIAATITWSDKVISYAPPSASDVHTWTDQWIVISNEAIDNFTFTQGSYIPAEYDYGDNFIVICNSITENNLNLEITVKNKYAGGFATYPCTLEINGTVSTAILTIEYAPQGS